MEHCLPNEGVPLAKDIAITTLAAARDLIRLHLLDEPTETVEQFCLPVSWSPMRLSTGPGTRGSPSTSMRLDWSCRSMTKTNRRPVPPSP